MTLDKLTPESSIDDLLPVFFSARRIGKEYALQFRTMAKWLRRVLKRPPLARDLRPETLPRFRNGMVEMGELPSYSEKVSTRFITLWKFAAESNLTVPCEYERTRRPGPQALPLPTGDEGTLLALFWDRYAVENAVSSCQTAHYFSTFRKLRDCFGTDLKIADLSPSTVPTFVAFLHAAGLKPGAVRAQYKRLLAVWRFAHREGLTSVFPRDPRLKVPRQTPDAWTIDEFRKIVEAASRLDRPPIGGVRASKFWRAILLTAYYSALRRGSLLRLRPQDIDLTTGWLRVPAEAMKNKCGQALRLGGDAIEALRDIWDERRERVFPVPLDSAGSTMLSETFHAILKAAGLPENLQNRMSKFHKIRRTAVTTTAAKVGLAEAIALAGHSGADVNARYIDPRFMPKNDATRWLPPIIGPTPDGPAPASSQIESEGAA